MPITLILILLFFLFHPPSSLLTTNIAPYPHWLSLFFGNVLLLRGYDILHEICVHE